jgi:hypothetical protein
MTYILNAIVIGSRVPVEASVGQIVIEIDDPPDAVLRVETETFVGMRHLIVVDDGDGYRSSMRLVSVPPHSEQPTVLSVPIDLQGDFRQALELLLSASPRRGLLLYLEANRSLSRADPDDIFPARSNLVHRENFSDLWRAVERGEVEEDEPQLLVEK